MLFPHISLVSLLSTIVGLSAYPIITPNWAEIPPPNAEDVALSDGGNQISERREVAPHMRPLQRAATVWPDSSSQKCSGPE